MRKFALAAVALVCSIGLTLAADVVFVSYDKDKKELTVKDGDKEKTYKVGDKVKFKDNDKDMEHEKGIERLEKTEKNEKAKGKAKMTITVEDDKLTEIKFPMRKGKGKN